MTEAAKAVCAVVVTYHPEPGVVGDLLQAVMPQVGAVVVVDNTGDRQGNVTPWLPSGIELIGLPGNAGLAAAQNIGIAWARSHGFRYVLLLDQDSQPGDGMVAALLAASVELGDRAAAVGPHFHDPRIGRDAPFVRIRFPFNHRLWCEPGCKVIRCDFLISSGMLVPMTVLDRVGGMDADLFIDNIDLEWCFRARARGYGLYGVCSAAMHHRLGDARRALFFGRVHVVVHGPQRLYFMMRNRVRLYWLPHTPSAWVAQDLLRVLVKLFLFGVLVGPRLRNLRCMLRGLWDGMRGRGGAFPYAA